MKNEPSRPAFLPPPLPVEQRVGMEAAGGQGDGGARQGDLLGPLGAPMALGPVLSGDVESLQGTAARRVPPGRDADDGRPTASCMVDKEIMTEETYGIMMDKETVMAELDNVLQEKGKVVTVVGSRLSESRALSVNLFPESEMGRQPSGAGGPARSFSPVPTVMVGEERNPFSAGVNFSTRWTARAGPTAQRSLRRSSWRLSNNRRCGHYDCGDAMLQGLANYTYNCQIHWSSHMC